ERGGERARGVMAERRRVDAFVGEQAAEAGAEFRDGLRATAVEGDGTVRFDGTAAQAEAVIGADGVNGLTARALGFGDRRHGVALEGNVSYVHAREHRWRGRAVVELGTVPGGYAWVFPKGEHVNVGVGGWQSEGPRLRERLRELCGAVGIDEAVVHDLRGHRLPMRGAARRPGHGRVLLLADPARPV